ncbi:MAG: transcription antitermination factor NusB [Phycisphaeraceae bacterium]|nr:transcription antitermination factor NusB [Phycisphaeraceae bacterium]
MSVKKDLRRMAMEDVLVLGDGDASLVQESTAEDALASLAPQERERVLTIAARRLAFQVLFELDSRRTQDASEAASILSRARGITPEQVEAMMVLVSGAYMSRKVADDAFQKIAPEWPSHRMAPVDRAILRLAYYEMTATQTHPRIVINEAVELAKSFSSEKSPAFVNGLLDRVLKGAGLGGKKGTSEDESA